MSSMFSVDLTYDVIICRRVPLKDYADELFEKRIMGMLCSFDDLFCEHILCMPTSYEFFGGFDYNFSTSEKIADGHYKVTLSASYEPGLSRKAVEQLGEKAKEYVKTLNSIFKLFDVDVEFLDNPVVDYVDDGEDYEDD